MKKKMIPNAPELLHNVEVIQALGTSPWSRRGVERKKIIESQPNFMNVYASISYIIPHTGYIFFREMVYRFSFKIMNVIDDFATYKW